MNQEVDLKSEPIDLFYWKIEHAKDIMRESIEKYPNIAVACSFGKDSMVVVDVARQVDPNIPIFAIMTPHKPPETFEYLVRMNSEMNLNVKVFLVADEIPKILKDANIELDRKIMADLAMNDPDTFAKLVEIAKQQLGLLSQNARPKAGDAKT